MKEFIDKLIERFEEEREKSFSKYRESFELYVEEFWRGRMGGFENVIKIVNELAEECKEACEYKGMIAPSGDVFFLTDCGNRHNGYLDNNRPYCGFCGKKIKFAPYTEGE